MAKNVQYFDNMRNAPQNVTSIFQSIGKGPQQAPTKSVVKPTTTNNSNVTNNTTKNTSSNNGKKDNWDYIKNPLNGKAAQTASTTFTSNLQMPDADVAVSKQGIANFINQINANMKDVQNHMSVDSDGFRSIIRYIQDYWSGEDAQNFIADLRNAAADLASYVVDIYQKLINSLNDYYSAFLKMQSGTYQKGTIKIKRV